MKHGEKAPKPTVGKRARRVVGVSLLLSVPTFVINLLFQGRREFQAELEAWRKYRKIINKIKRKG